MRKGLLLIVILFNVLFLSAQHLKIEKQKSQLYITHKVSAKETLYSLARMYHLTAKDIAAANQLKADAGLQIGQHIKIPLKQNNFVQTTSKNKAGLQAVYHTIKKGENLYKISKAYNNVKEATLKQLNHLTKNTIQPGQELIVGYVKVNKNIQQEKTEPAVATTSTKTDISKNTKETSTTTVATTTSVKQVNPTTQQSNVVNTVFTASGEGFFAGNYSINAATATEKKISGTAATFKSTSGWNDKKYYVLINDLPTETIVKITVNGKSVFAKVLESLPELRDNKGLLCRISNAAASALGITDAKFDLEISYYE